VPIQKIPKTKPTRVFVGLEKLFAKKKGKTGRKKEGFANPGYIVPKKKKTRLPCPFSKRGDKLLRLNSGGISRM